MPRTVRTLIGVMAVLASTSCRDEDVADEPILPDNVGASVEGCEIAAGAPVASVEVTNGTGHPASFDVTVAFVRDGRTDGTALQRTPVVDPGSEAIVEVGLDGGGAAGLDDCSIEDVSEVDD